MNNSNLLYLTVHYSIATVWLANGLLCKILNLVPRHQQIVARILGVDYAGVFTKAIGVGEVLIALWIISSYKPRLCAMVQIALVLAMNIMEFLLVPDLLLFGRLNAFFALCFVIVVYCHQFVLRPRAAL
jgi:uncharacterized membrane protein YphA (DoxX/SURF4 family)